MTSVTSLFPNQSPAGVPGEVMNTITPVEYGDLIQQRAREQAGLRDALLPKAVLQTYGNLAIASAASVRDESHLPDTRLVRNILGQLDPSDYESVGEITAMRLLRAFVGEARGFEECIVHDEQTLAANERGEL